MDSTAEACKRLAKAIAGSGIKAPMFGGFVLPLYGVERMTLDMDFLLAECDLPPFEKVLATIGYEKVFRSAQYAKFRHPSPEVLDVDTVFADPATIEIICQTATMRQLAGASFLCVSLDTLIGTKLHAVRHNEERRGYKDFNDILELIAANSIDPHAKHFQDMCLKYGTDEIYQRVLTEVARDAQ